MKSRAGLLVGSWVVTFGAATWWVASEGDAPVGSAVAVGAIVATLLAVALRTLFKG